MNINEQIAGRLANLSPEKRERLKSLLRDRSDSPSEPRARPAGSQIPLSFGQRRLWMLEALSSGTGAYNETNSLRFTFSLHENALRSALNTVVNRHEALRMRIRIVDGQPFQDFAPADASIDIPLIDLRYLPTVEREDEALRQAVDQSRIAFDLEHDPPLRLTLYRLGDADHLLVVTLHHMVCDGWSMGIFMVELLVLYWTFVAGRASPFTELPLQYGDYALWQQQFLGSTTERKQREYWRGQLDGLSTLDLPVDRPRPAEFSFRGARIPVSISATTVSALRALAEREGVTVFILLYALFAVLLHRYTGQDDIVIGTPSAGRTRRAFESIIGFFVNTLVLRLDAGGNPSFTQLLGRAKNVATAAYENQDLPFERVVEEMHPVRDRSRNPLYQVAFQLMNRPSATGLDERALLPFVPVDTSIAKFDLSLELMATKEGIRGHAEYCVDLFDEARIARMMRHLSNLIDNVLSDPGKPVAELEMRDETEIQTLTQWRSHSAPYPREQTLAEAFLAQVDRSPNAIALRCGSDVWSYSQLRTRAAALADVISERGVPSGALIGVHIDRSAEFIIALLGIVLHGSAYLPVDPQLPRERVRYMLEDAGVAALITATHDPALSKLAARVIAMSEGAAISQRSSTGTTAEDLAYVMYTSGTTGQPKGVAVSHRNIIRLAHSRSLAAFEAGTRVLHFSSPSFDASTFEIWCCLLNGGQLVVFPSGVPSLDELATFIEAQGIDVAFLTTSLFRQIVEHCPQKLRNVAQLITGGEQLRASDARAAWKALPRSRITNAYGPTEATVMTSAYVIAGLQPLDRAVPIGRPLENSNLYVLDRYDNPAPIGVPGELCIGGDGVAIGYWRRTELTASRFVSTAISQERVYRTGDTVSYREDGNLIFLGRKDRQIKLNGYRIELGEIEAAILKHPRVRATAVIVSGAEEKRLVAFCELHEQSSLSLKDLREFLATSLPHYMLPGRLLIVDALPLSPNGKLDIPVLVTLDAEGTRSDVAKIAPRNTLERELVKVWCELLEVTDAGVTDNFFDSGGQSLVATRLLSRIASRYDARVSMREFFDQPTVERLAALLAERGVEARELQEADSEPCQ